MNNLKEETMTYLDIKEKYEVLDGLQDALDWFSHHLDAEIPAEFIDTIESAINVIRYQTA